MITGRYLRECFRLGQKEMPNEFEAKRRNRLPEPIRSRSDPKPRRERK